MGTSVATLLGQIESTRRAFDKPNVRIPDREGRLAELSHIEELLRGDEQGAQRIVDVLGITRAVHFPQDGHLITQLGACADFFDVVNHGREGAAAKRLRVASRGKSLKGVTGVHVYDVQAPNLSGSPDNLFLFAYSGLHRYLSRRLEIEPVMYIAGPEMMKTNFDYREGDRIDPLIRRREKNLAKIGIETRVMDYPDRINSLVGYLRDNDNMKSVVLNAGRAVTRGKVSDESMLRYFLAELALFARVDEANTLSFHFGPKSELKWDECFEALLARKDFGEFCNALGYEQHEGVVHAGLHYEQPRLHFRDAHGVRQLRPYSASPDLVDVIPHIRHSRESIDRRFYQIQSYLDILSIGLTAALMDVTEVQDDLANNGLYQSIRSALSGGQRSELNVIKRINEKEAIDLMVVANSYLNG